MYATPATGSSQNPNDLEDYLLGKKRVDKILIGTENEKVSFQATLSCPSVSSTFHHRLVPRTKISLPFRMRIPCGILQLKSVKTHYWQSSSRKPLLMRHSCLILCVCVRCRSATVSNLRRRRRKKRNARERSSDVGKGKNVTVLDHHSLTMMVAMTATIPHDHDALRALETVTLALLSIPVDSEIATTVLALHTLPAGMSVAVVAQILVTRDENGVMALTQAEIVLWMNGGLDGHARTSLTLRRTTSGGGAGNVLARPRGVYGMVTIAGPNALAAIPPRSRPLVIRSAHVPARLRGHQWPPKIAQHALPL